MKTKFLVILITPLLSVFLVNAMVDCRDNLNGCTIQQLLDIGDKSPTSKEDRVNAYKSAIEKINLKIKELESVQISTNDNCKFITNNLWQGKSDKETNGEVSLLQKFLVTNNYLATGNVSGYYGNLTADAVFRFQKARDLNYVTIKSGVGAVTRAKIGCIAENDEIQGFIKNINPVSGPIGTTVEVTGSGLSGFEGDLLLTFEKSDGSKVVLSDTAGSYAKTQDKRMVVVVKEPCKKGESWYPPADGSGLPKICNYEPMTPGLYKVYANGWNTSNAVTFTVTP